MLKSILLFITAVLLCSLGFIYWRLLESRAPLDGTIRISSLSKEVTIYRDIYGIPHIEAESHRDGLRALGFVVASERLFQMEVTRRLAYGELSEVFGPQALETDKLFRSLTLKRAAERVFELEKKEGRFSQQTWDDIQAYFDGVNEFMRTRPRPFELQLINVRPRPFTPIDAYVMTGYMSFGFAVPMKLTSLLSNLAKDISPRKLNELRNFQISNQKVSLTDKFKKSEGPFWKEIERFMTQLGLPQFDGSNAWLLSPQKSASKKSLFVNDPHVAYSNPAVWFEAHLKTSEMDIYGHYLPLIPFPILGHTNHHAWGFTMALMDDMDFYREKIDREKQQVIFNNSPVSYQSWKEVIKVKNQKDTVLEMIETPHGPLLNAVLAEKDIAFQWQFLNSQNNPVKSLWGMSRAKNRFEFENALKYTTAPGLNVMYADPDNIAWWIAGNISLRSNPNSDLIFDGASGQDEIISFMRWEDKPHLINPPEGYIVTANSKPPGIPDTMRGDWQSGNRKQTIIEALQSKNIWTVEETKKLQTLNYGQQTPKILKKLISCLQLEDTEEERSSSVLEMLNLWNHHSDIDMVAPSFYHLWNNYNLQNLLIELDKDSREIFLGSSYAWIFYERQILEYDCQKDASLAEKITDAFRMTVNDPNSTKKWGDIHTVEYIHPLGKLKPLNYIYNVGPYPAPGAYNEINNLRFKIFGRSFSATAGPSSRRIIDLNDTKLSWGINPLGVSGNLLSPYRTTDVQRYLRGEYREQFMDWPTIKSNAAHKLVLK